MRVKDQRDKKQQNVKRDQIRKRSHKNARENLSENLIGDQEESELKDNDI